MTARGVCPVCGSLRARRRDGMIRGHDEPGTCLRCEGSGQAPATKEQRAALDEAFATQPDTAA